MDRCLSKMDQFENEMDRLKNKMDCNYIYRFIDLRLDVGECGCAGWSVCTGWSRRFLTHQPPPISKGKHFQNYKVFPENLEMVPM